MSDPSHEKALETRRAFAAHSAAIGIDEEFIGTLVDTFYTRVRAHAILGPIFERAIEDRWGVHLAKMKTFWSSIAFMSGSYHGKPMETHGRLPDIQPWHFGIWLGLFRQTVAELAPSPEAAAFFTERAERIAESLKLGLFYRPGAANKQI